MNLIQLYNTGIEQIEKLKSVPLLMVRLALAYGFYIPASRKWEDINAIAEWFENLQIPAPLLNAYLAAGTEALGVVLLTLGLATRFISLPLIITMIVAIKTVHLENGFDAGNNGLEIPLYYLIMLVLLVVYGPGQLSFDHWIDRKTRNKNSKNGA